MRILSWNVNGIRAVERKGFSEWFSSDGPDILCLQETKAMPDQLSERLLSPSGYHSYWNNPRKKGYAGVAVYTKQEPIKVEYDFPPKSLDTEGRCLVLYFKEFVIINCYFPNGGMGPERLAYKLDFYEKFLKFSDKIKDRRLILCGDVNTAHKEIDLARPKQNEMNTGFLPEERAWIDELLSHGYVDIFRKFNDKPGQYSWWDYKTRARERNVGWRIDYFFVTNEFAPKVKDAFILSEVEGSDHCPIGIEI